MIALPSFRSASSKRLAGLLAAIGCAPAAAACPQGLQLTASDAGDDDHFGRALAVSGNTVVATSRYDEHAGLGYAGSAYVLVHSGAAWTEQAKLTADDAAPQDLFGHAVAVSGDTVILSARNDDHSGLTDAGSAYVFVRNAASWTQQAKLVAPDAADFDHFGISLALFGDTAIVGAAFDDHAGGVDAGSAYVFVRSGTTWTLQAKLIPGDSAAEDWFGWSVALYGNSAIIGAPSDDTAAGIDTGSGYHFVRTGTTWSQAAKLLAPDAAPGDRLGNSVAHAGSRAVLGCELDDHAGKLDAGSVYGFTHNGTSWALQAKVISSDVVDGDGFGHAVALAGNTLLVGAAQAEVAGVNAVGAAYAFVWNGASWVEQPKLVASGATPNENLGSAVGLCDSTAVVGVPHDDVADQQDAGSVYAFEITTDCNGNGVPDTQDLAVGNSTDCNQNGVPDECDIHAGAALDLDGEGTPDKCQAFSASGATLSIAVGGTLSFALHAGASHAGELYFVLGSLSGTAPGIPVDGSLLPLNPDAYFALTLAGGAPLQGKSGVLDAAGTAGAALVLPAGLITPGLAGIVADHAFALLSPTALGVTLTSNPIPTTLAP